jgi:hypothetical protein
MEWVGLKNTQFDRWVRQIEKTYVTIDGVKYSLYNKPQAEKLIALRNKS